MDTGWLDESRTPAFRAAQHAWMHSEARTLLAPLRTPPATPSRP